MSDRSGLEILEELLLEVKELRKEIKVLDFKIAQIANSAKIAEIMKMLEDSKFKDFVRSKPKAEAVISPAKAKAEPVPAPTGIKNFKFERSDASKIDQVQPNRAGKKSTNSSTLVSGKMITQINNKDVALSGLAVKIYDAQDKLVKETKTNRAGTWMSHLTAGQYVANIEGQYKGQDLVPVNIMFEVKEGMKTLEVK